MAFLRRVRTASGATAVQIVRYVDGRQRIVKHVGSAHSEAELGVLLAKARELLEDRAQGVLDFDVEPTVPVARLLGALVEPSLFEVGGPSAPEEGHDGPGRVVGTDCRLLFEALSTVYADLGFDAVEDEVFRDLVIARVVEPTSLLDMGRVLTELGRSPASYSTMRRTLARAQKRTYRDRIATACFAHAASTGDVSLILYDVTTLYFAAQVLEPAVDVPPISRVNRSCVSVAPPPGRRLRSCPIASSIYPGCCDVHWNLPCPVRATLSGQLGDVVGRRAPTAQLYLRCPVHPGGANEVELQAPIPACIRNGIYSPNPSGNAETSPIESARSSCMQIRSKPSPNPPCGGQASRTSNKPPIIFGSIPAVSRTPFCHTGS